MASSGSFTASGTAIARKLIGQKPIITSKVKQAMNVEAEKVATRSKREFVPVDKGTLRSSITVVHAAIEGDDLVVYIVAGGPGIPHALAIHEHRSEHSPATWSGVVNFRQGGVKYLELPLMEAIPGLNDRLAAIIGF